MDANAPTTAPRDDLAAPNARGGDLSSLMARDVMTSPAVVCRKDAFLAEIAEIIAEWGVSGVPVIDEAEGVVGMVSERDLAHALGSPLVRLAVRRSSEGRHTIYGRSPVRAADIMTTPLIIVSPSTPVSELARLMVTEDVNRLPVVDAGRLVGIVARTDVLRAVAGLSNPGHADAPERMVVLGGSGGIGAQRPTHSFDVMSGPFDGPG